MFCFSKILCVEFGLFGSKATGKNLGTMHSSPNPGTDLSMMKSTVVHEILVS